MFLTRENDIFAFQNIAITKRAKRERKKFDRFCQRFSNYII